MGRCLCIAVKLSSPNERFQVTSEAGEVLYECTSNFRRFNPLWTLTRDGTQVAEFRRAILSWAPTWKVTSVYGDYRLRQKLSVLRRVIVQGGSFDGAELTGTLLNMDFNVTFREGKIARAQRRLFLDRARTFIDLVEETPEAEILTVVLMANHLVEQTREGTEEGFTHNQEAM